MQLIDQKTKKIMEGCKEHAREAGLDVPLDTLEYIVTNRDMINLSPKVMIPTLYDYWLNDVEVHKGQGRYKLYPSNPYETVINSRPPISFYNDNNPDWLNIMIFYHVIAHIDFFRNNVLFENTWKDDFIGKALADKRLIELLRSKHGRWVDYVIEFGRSIDNITGYYNLLPKLSLSEKQEPGQLMTYFINIFLPDEVKMNDVEILKFVEKYNKLVENNFEMADSVFFAEIRNKFPEFEPKYKSYLPGKQESVDLLEYIINESPFINKPSNLWMKSILNIIRETSLYFAPQMRTKIMNEGWASYWHEKLFISDERISGHEAQFAKVNAGVTSISRVGLNPYAIGLRLFKYIEENANRGKFSFDYQKLTDRDIRKKYNLKTGEGKKTIFDIRKIYTDFNFINTFVDQDFLDMYNLFVTGKRLDKERGVFQYYVKSRKVEDYKKMLIDSMYHPPFIKVDLNKTNEENLFIDHIFEGKQLFKEYIDDTLVGLEYLWGGSVNLVTTEIVQDKDKKDGQDEFKFNKVMYRVSEKKVSKTSI